jgi:translation initiation factor IF-1
MVKTADWVESVSYTIQGAMEVREITNKDEKIELEGVVTEAFPAGKFKIELDNGHELTGYVSGKMRRYNIRVLLGDRVRVEVSPYDLDRGRIIYRYKRKIRIPKGELATQAKS